MPQVRQLTDRNEIYKAINREREYQDARKGNSARETDDQNRDLGSLILFMETYVEKARLAFSAPMPAAKEAALHEIRKVAALAVLAMEYHGAYERA